MSVEFIVRLRDAAQMLVDAAEEYLEKMAPVNKRWDPKKVKWTPEEAQSGKGPYELAEPQATDDFKNMLQDIKDHKNFLSRGDYKYWIFSDAARVGRRKKS